MALNVLTVLNRRDITFNIDNTHLMYKGGFLRSKVMYLKDYSPYPDSPLLAVNLRIQLELIYWVTTPLVIKKLLTCFVIYTPSLLTNPP